jgi:hypothetical protein
MSTHFFMYFYLLHGCSSNFWRGEKGERDNRSEISKPKRGKSGQQESFEF